ncbi:hypothetical protein Tco_0429526 [Tanacetum coccineum]
MNQNYFEPNLSYSGFDQPSQYPIDQSPPQEMSIQYMEDLKQQYLDEMKSMINQIQIKDYRNERINICYKRECEIKIDELKGKFNGISIKIYKKKELRQLEQAANVSTHTPESLRRFNSIYYDDDDDEESFIAITSDFPITNSLIMEDELLDTIPETESESDEENKSSVEDLNLTPSESEDLSDIESECDMPVCDDFTTFSILIFDSNDDFTSKSLLNRDNLIVSSPNFDSLLEEFSGELAHYNLISPEIDEADFDLEEEIRLVEKFLYDNSSPQPPKELNSENSDAVIESFSPSPIPSFHFDRYYDPSPPRPPAKPPDDDGIHFDIEPDTRILTAKVVDDISEHYVLMPSILTTHPTRCPVIDTLLPFSSENENKVFNSGILASNEEKSPHLLSHRAFKAYQIIYDFSKIPMMIYGRDSPILDVLFLHFYPP